MRDISLATVLSLGAQELETAALKCRFRRVAAHEMRVLHSVSQLVHRTQQLSIDAAPGDGPKQESLMSGNLCGQVQAGRIGHESLSLCLLIGCASLAIASVVLALTRSSENQDGRVIPAQAGIQGPR